MDRTESEISTPREWAMEGLTFATAFQEYERLRDECPVAHSHEHGGFWTAMRHEDIRHVLQQLHDFESGRPFIRRRERQRFIPLTLNSPEHEKYRSVLNPLFRPRRINNLEAEVQKAARGYLEPLIESGEGDFQEQVANPLPAHALCIFLGIPVELVPQLKSLSLESVTHIEDPDRQASVFRRMRELITEIVKERRKAPKDPETDFFSALLAASVDGKPLPLDEVVTIGHQMIGAGHDTSSHAMGSLIYRMAAHSDQQERLRQDPALIPSAIDEVLRLEPPLHHIGRETTRDVDIAGCPIAAGQAVTLNVASANRDPEVFTSPNDADFSRSPNRHLTFGQGVHMCLGSRLARLEMTVVLQELLDQTTWIELSAPVKRTTITLSGFDALTVRLIR